MKSIGLLGAKGAGKDTLALHLTAQGFTRIGFADELYSQVAAAYSQTVAFFGKRETKETDLPELALVYCTNPQFVEVALQSLTTSRNLRKAALIYGLTGKFVKHCSRRRVKDLMLSWRSPRWTMQLWGTEYRRMSKYGVDNYWLDIVEAMITRNPDKSFVITDVRFFNEALLVKRLDGVLIRIRRPLVEQLAAADRARNGTAAHPSEVALLDYTVDHEVLNEEGQPDSLAVAYNNLELAFQN